MKVLVCGGRNYNDKIQLFIVLDKINRELGIREIINGGATGADKLSSLWAEVHLKHCAVCPADWKKHGKAAGPIRNQKMLEGLPPDLVVAFPGGSGTKNMVSLAKRAGIRVIEIPVHLPPEQ